MTDVALRARRRNMGRVRRLRSNTETAIIKRLIWQLFFDSGPHLSQRALARELRVWPSYVCKVQRRARSGEMDTLLRDGGRVGPDDLEQARCFSDRIREQEPGLLAPTPLTVTPVGKSAAPAQPCAPRPPQPPASPSAPESLGYVIPERYRNLDKWKEQYYAAHPWLRGLRTDAGKEGMS